MCIRDRSRVVRRAINVDFLRPNGDTFKKKVFVDQRQVVFYSKKYADRSKAKREAVLKKAQCIVDNPSAYTKATSYGALRYIENIEVDKKTGEIKERDKSVPYCLLYTSNSSWDILMDDFPAFSTIRIIKYILIQLIQFR